MENSGFKGHRVGLDMVTLKGSQVHVDVQFMDDDGLVHAAGHHKISIGEHEHLRDTAQAFLTALTHHIIQIHFTDPSTPANQEEAAHGIAEALRGGGTDDTDGFEEGS